jgi:hypothetical protein
LLEEKKLSYSFSVVLLLTMQIKFKISGLTFLIIFCFLKFGHAVELTPFSVRNLSPTALVHGLAIAESSKVLSPGDKMGQFSFDIVNNAILNQSLNETIILDGETYIGTLSLRYGLAKQIQLGFDLPYIHHSGGFLDSFISDWHDFFGLPNGDRDKFPDNQLNYSYKDATEGFSLESKDGGLGDLRANLVYELASGENTSYAIQLSIKAPTGNAEKLTGSEAWNTSLALMTQYEISLPSGTFSFWAGGAGNYLGNGEILKDRVNNWVVNGWLGGGWSPYHWLGLKIQFDSHSSLYDSNLKEIGDPALIMTLGGSVVLTEKTIFELAFSEDLNVEVSPDIAFHLSLKHNF